MGDAVFFDRSGRGHGGGARGCAASGAEVRDGEFRNDAALSLAAPAPMSAAATLLPAALASMPAQEVSVSSAATPSRVKLIYESRDKRYCLFQDAGGHLTSVRSSRLA